MAKLFMNRLYLKRKLFNDSNQEQKNIFRETSNNFWKFCWKRNKNEDALDVHTDRFIKGYLSDERSNLSIYFLLHHV